MICAQQFIDSFENPTENIDYDPNMQTRYDKNTQILMRIKDAVLCIAKFVRIKIKAIMEETKYFSMIADEVTDRYSNKEILLLCLRYLNIDHKIGAPVIEEIFLDSKRRGSSVIKNKQRLADWFRCRNYCINLAIAFACKNASVTNFMESLTNVLLFRKFSQTTAVF